MARVKKEKVKTCAAKSMGAEEAGGVWQGWRIVGVWCFFRCGFRIFFAWKCGRCLEIGARAMSLADVLKGGREGADVIGLRRMGLAPEVVARSRQGRDKVAWIRGEAGEDGEMRARQGVRVGRVVR